jgi:cytochrome c-type biogenesis protein CcmE
MKRTQIILLLVIALMIGALLVTLEDASVYATFDIADKQTPETVTVVAKLDLENPIEFDPKTTLLTFKAIDKMVGQKMLFITSQNQWILSAQKK